MEMEKSDQKAVPAETVLSRELRFSATPSSGRSQTRDKQSPGPQNAVSVSKNKPSPFPLRIQGDPASSLARYCFVSRDCELWGQGADDKTSAGLWAGIFLR